MSAPTCSRHGFRRPCPRCAELGHGGAGRGQGRKPVYIDPVRVTLTVERAELAAAQALYPGESKAGALRLALLEVPELALTSEIVVLESAAAREPPAIPRGTDSAEATLTHREWREVARVLTTWRLELKRNEFLQREAERFGAWIDALPIPRETPEGASDTEVAAILSREDCRRIWQAVAGWLDARADPELEEVEFRRRYHGLKSKLEDPRLRERHRLEFRRDTLRVRAAAAKVPHPADIFMDV